MDFVVRFDFVQELEDRIKSKARSKKELSEIRDEFYKPEGTSLDDFHPGEVIIRKRTFPDRETLVKINIINKSLGYTDTKEDIESVDGYEKWGEFRSSAVEYTLDIENKEVSILVEEFSFGKYIKIEAPSEEVLESIVQELNLSKDKLIEKNSAELLAEHIDAIIDAI